MNDIATHSGHQEAHQGNRRPDAPEGMTYNRKGELVKRRKQQAHRSNKVFLVLQIVDDNGQPTDFGKQNVRIVGVMKNSDKVLELLDSGEHQGAFYIRHDFSAQ